MLSFVQSYLFNMCNNVYVFLILLQKISVILEKGGFSLKQFEKFYEFRHTIQFSFSNSFIYFKNTKFIVNGFF